PLKIGTTWTYTITTQQKDKTEKQVNTFILTAIKEDKVGNQACVKFEAKLGEEVVSSEHVAILNDGVYRFKFGDKTIEPPICFFNASSKKGESWSQDFKVGDVGATVKYEMGVEDVEVRAGKFKDALVAKAEATEKVGEEKKTTKTTIW